MLSHPEVSCVLCCPLCGKPRPPLYAMHLFWDSVRLIGNRSSFILPKLSEFAARFIFQDPLFCVVSDVRKFILCLKNFSTGDFIKVGSPSGQEEPTVHHFASIHTFSISACSRWGAGVCSSCQVGSLSHVNTETLVHSLHLHSHLQAVLRCQET